MKLRLELSGDIVFYYPDLLLTGDPDDRETYYRMHPCLIVEVLSEATERIDRREKRLAYATIESLRAYVLLSQDRIQAEVYRPEEGWRGRAIQEGSITVDCLNVAIPLSTVYEDVSLLSP